MIAALYLTESLSISTDIRDSSSRRSRQTSRNKRQMNLCAMLITSLI